MIHIGYNRRQAWNCLYWYRFSLRDYIDSVLDGRIEVEPCWEKKIIDYFKIRNSVSEYDDRYLVGTINITYKNDPKYDQKQKLKDFKKSQNE